MPRQRQKNRGGRRIGPASISQKANFEIYGLKTQVGELVALGVYEISEDVVTVHIVYMESQAQSNPTLCERPKYRGIGRALIAYGIKLSVDAGFNGDVKRHRSWQDIMNGISGHC